MKSRKVKNSKRISPREVTRESAIIKLKSDNISTKKFWALIHGRHITIAKQANGEQADFMIEIPKKDFNTIIDWYNKKQPPIA